MPDYRVEVDHQSLERFIFALTIESDGKALRRDFIKYVRKAAEPAKDAAKAAILAMPTKKSGTVIHEQSLRLGISNSITIRVSTAISGKRRPGVAVRARKTPNLRGFALAPRRTNRKRGWRHPLFGDRDQWFDQTGLPGWFDNTLQRFVQPVLRGCKQAMDDMARRISQRTSR